MGTEAPKVEKFKRVVKATRVLCKCGTPKAKPVKRPR